MNRDIDIFRKENNTTTYKLNKKRRTIPRDKNFQ